MTNESTIIPNPLNVKEVEKINRKDVTYVVTSGFYIIHQPYIYLDGWNVFDNEPPVIKRLELNNISFKFATSDYTIGLNLPLFLIVNFYKEGSGIGFIKDRQLVRILLNFQLQADTIYDIAIANINPTNSFIGNSTITDTNGSYVSHLISLNQPIIVPELDTNNGDYVEIYLATYDKNTNTFSHVTLNYEGNTSYNCLLAQFTAYY
jgi:hypothetical protein